MRRSMVFVLTLMLLCGCGKKQTIRISVTNAVTGKPYSGLEYTIRKQTTSFNGEKNKTIEKGTLDQDGKAIVTMYLKNASYELNIQDPGNLCYKNNVSYTFTRQDSNFEFDYKLAECAFLTLSIHNQDCQGESDKIVFDLQPSYIQNYTTIMPMEKLGCYSNTFIESTVPYGEWSATWEVTRNGITSYHDSTFFINKDEHHEFVINY